jgi:predicted HicB family RNase H-like nuclease
MNYGASPGELAVDRQQQELRGISCRKPQRITITVSHSVHQALMEESLHQGRSLSNLASVWLEQQAALAIMRKTRHTPRP